MTHFKRFNNPNKSFTATNPPARFKFEVGLPTPATHIRCIGRISIPLL